jgi:hypothetical protein
MSYYLPNGSTLEIGTPGTPISITALTNASEAVATCANSFVAGDVVFLSSGWGKLDGRAVRVKSPTGTTFILEAIDTTDTVAYPVGGGVGTAAKVAVFSPINQVQTFNLTGGDQNFLDVQFLSDDVKKKIPTVKNSIELKLEVAEDITQAWYTLGTAANLDLQPRVIRLNKKSGAKSIMAGVTTMAPIAKLTINNLATVEMTCCINALPANYAT